MVLVCVAEGLVLDIAALVVVVVASGAGNPITIPITPKTKTKTTEIIITLSQQVGS
jgi:hypothetical protein